MVLEVASVVPTQGHPITLSGLWVPECHGQACLLQQQLVTAVNSGLLLGQTVILFLSSCGPWRSYPVSFLYLYSELLVERFPFLSCLHGNTRIAETCSWQGYTRPAQGHCVT